MTLLLLVEDNALNRDMLSRRLARVGYHVAVAVNGQEGVDLARELKPALVLMDINMPVMDGWQAAKILKDDPPTATMPIVALTAHAMAGNQEKAAAIGFDGFAAKPVDFPALIQTIEDLLNTPPKDQTQDNNNKDNNNNGA